MRKIGKKELEDIALGAAVLGTGGGGDPYIGKLMAIQAVEENGPITLLEASDLDDDDLVLPGAMMGAPTVLVEKVPSGDEVFNAFQSLENYLGKEVKATMPIEAGGVNSMIPFALAANLDIPVIDADGMGRAFPELQMVTFSIIGASSTPMALADEKGNNLLLNTIDNKWTEDLARGATVKMGGSVMIAIYPLSGSEVKEAGIKNVVTYAENIGKAIRKAKENKTDPVKALKEVTDGYQLFEGKVVDIKRETKGGFAQGNAEIKGINEYSDQKLTLNFQNEHLVAKLDGEVIASVPDLITVHDKETGQPITTEGMKYGNRVIVMGTPCSEKWRCEKGLELVGPKYFGYDIEYVPVEERQER